MMNRILLVVCFATLSAFALQSDSLQNSTLALPIYAEKGFERGEVLEYKLNYLAMTIGKAQIKIQPKTYNINQRPCYKIDIYGKTSGMVDWVAKINDHWGAYVDTAALVPHIAYRKIEEGKYRKNEIVKFDHFTNMMEVKVVNKKTGDFKEPLYIEFANEMREMISGFAYIRSLNMDVYMIGDTITIPAFHEDTFYDFQIIYAGKEAVKTKFGKINAVKMVPIMPANKVFDGENAIAAWFSDDSNHLPLKVEANMFVGKAGVDIIHMEQIKHPLNFVKDVQKEKTTKSGFGENTAVDSTVQSVIKQEIQN